MALFRKYKNYFKISGLILAVSLFAFAIVYFLIINPQNKLKKDIKSKLIQSNQDYELAQIAASAKTQELINQEVEVLQNRLQDFVLDYKSAADLTFDISQIADECSISSFSVQSNDMQKSSTTSDPNNIIEKRIKVSFISGFQEFASFLNSIERHQPVLFIHEFMISRHNNSHNTNTFQVSLELAALVQKQDKKDELIISSNY